MVFYLYIMLTVPLESAKGDSNASDEEVRRQLQSTETYDLTFSTSYSYTTRTEFFNNAKNYYKDYPEKYDYHILAHVPMYNYSGVYIEIYIYDGTTNGSGFDLISSDW